MNVRNQDSSLVYCIKQQVIGVLTKAERGWWLWCRCGDHPRAAGGLRLLTTAHTTLRWNPSRLQECNNTDF